MTGIAMKKCPAGLGDSTTRDSDGRYVCKVCGRHVSALGYSRRLANHNAPADVVDEFVARVRARTAAGLAERDERVSAERKLTEAFHLLFDVKDDLWPKGWSETATFEECENRCAVNEAIGAAARAMRYLGMEAPMRSDHVGR